MQIMEILEFLIIKKLMWHFFDTQKNNKKSWDFLDNSEIFDTKFDVIQQIVAWFNAILILNAHKTTVVVTCKELNYRSWAMVVALMREETNLWLVDIKYYKINEFMRLLYTACV